MYVSNAPIQNEGRQSWVRCFSWNWILDLFARWMSFGFCEVLGGKVRKLKMVPWNSYRKLAAAAWASVAIVKLIQASKYWKCKLPRLHPVMWWFTTTWRVVWPCGRCLILETVTTSKKESSDKDWQYDPSMCCNWNVVLGTRRGLSRSMQRLATAKVRRPQYLGVVTAGLAASQWFWWLLLTGVVVGFT